MTRAIVAFSLLFFVACEGEGDGSLQSMDVDPTSDLSVPFPEVDTALPDFDTDTELDTEAGTEADPDTEMDSDSDSDSETTAAE